MPTSSGEAVGVRQRQLVRFSARDRPGSRLALTREAMGPEGENMVCMSEAPLVTSRSCGAARRAATQPRRQQPTRSCTNHKSFSSVVAREGDAASLFSSRAKSRRRSDPIGQGHRPADKLGRASLSSVGHNTPEVVTIAAAATPARRSLGSGRGKGSVTTSPGPRKRCLRSDSRREKEKEGTDDVNGSAVSFSYAPGGGKETPGRRSRDPRYGETRAGGNERGTTYKGSKAVDSFLAPDHLGKDSRTEEKGNDEEKGEKPERRRSSCRGPQRAATALAVTRLASSRQRNETTEKSGSEENKNEGKAWTHEKQQQQSQGPTVEAEAGVAFASGLVESLSEGSGGGKGMAEATNAHAPAPTSGGSLEKVWNAISASYFQDSLVVKDIISSLLVENGGTNPSTRTSAEAWHSSSSESNVKSNHNGATSGGQSLPRWAASDSGGGLSGPGRGNGGGGGRSIWVASTQRAEAGGDSRRHDRSWVPSVGRGVCGWETPAVESTWGTGRKGVRRAWTGCKGVPKSRPPSDGEDALACRESGVVVLPPAEPKTLESKPSTVALSQGNATADGGALASDTKSTDEISARVRTSTGSHRTAVAGEKPSCGGSRRVGIDCGGTANGRIASAPAAPLNLKSKSTPASVVGRSVVETQFVVTSDAAASAETESATVDAPDSSSRNQEHARSQASSPTPPRSSPGLTVTPLDTAFSPAVGNGYPYQPDVPAGEFGDASHHPQPSASVKIPRDHVGANAFAAVRTPERPPGARISVGVVDAKGLGGNPEETSEGGSLRPVGEQERSEVSVLTSAPAGEAGIFSKFAGSTPSVGHRNSSVTLVSRLSPKSQFKSQAHLVWPPISSRPFSTSLVGALSLGGGTLGMSPSNEGFNGKPSTGANEGPVDSAWCRQHPLTSSPSCDAPRAAQSGDSSVGTGVEIIDLSRTSSGVISSSRSGTDSSSSSDVNGDSREITGTTTTTFSSSAANGSSSSCTAKSNTRCDGGSSSSSSTTCRTTSGSTSGSDGRGSEQQVGREVNEVSLRLASVSEALALLEGVAILPALHKVSDTLRVDLDRRAEDRAKTTAASRTERAWRTSCRARCTTGKPPRAASSTSCSSSTSSGSGDASAAGCYRPSSGGRSTGRRKWSGSRRTELNREEPSRNLDEQDEIDDDSNDDSSEDEWCPSGRASKRRRCGSLRPNLKRKRRGRVGADVNGMTGSPSASESESAADEMPPRTRPRRACTTERDPQAAPLTAGARATAGLASWKGRRRTIIGASRSREQGVGRIPEECSHGGLPRRARNRKAGDTKEAFPGLGDSSGVCGWYQATTPSKKLFSSFTRFASYSRGPSAEDAQSSSSSSSWGDRHLDNDRDNAEADRKRYTCWEFACLRRAHYGTPGWVPMHCVEHRRDWEVFLKYACCLSEGCVEKPRFGIPGDRSRVYCRWHRVPGTVSLASAGWKALKDSRVAEPGGWVEAEEDGMGVPVDKEDVEEAEGEAKSWSAVASTSTAAAPPVRATVASTPDARVALSEPTVTTGTAPFGSEPVLPSDAGGDETEAAQAARRAKANAKPPADETLRSETTPKISAAEEAGSLTGAGGGERVCSGSGTIGEGDGAVVERKDRKGRRWRDVGKGIAVLRDMRVCRGSMVAAAAAAEAPEKKTKPASGNGDDSSESSKATKRKRSAKNKVVAEERRDRKRSVEPSRAARALPSSSGGHGNEAGSATGSSMEPHSDLNPNSDSDWESEPDPDSDNEDIAEDPVFVPGRYAFLVPSKKSNRPILVGKIVEASESPAGSVSAAASASPPPPPTIPASSATALLLAKAAELLVVRSEPGSPGATGFVDGAGAGEGVAKEAAPDPVDDDERRWIYVHWHTPASLNRKDYCRGPFTPDYVKKEGTKCGGWDPFVTKIRKRSVAVTCPGLLVSRCIPAEVLRELAV